MRSATTQRTANATSTVPSWGTLSAWDCPPLTVQFVATSLRVTVWGPTGTPGTITAPFIGSPAYVVHATPEGPMQTP